MQEQKHNPLNPPSFAKGDLTDIMVLPMRNWILSLRVRSGQASTTTSNTVWVKNWKQRIEIFKTGIPHGNNQ